MADPEKDVSISERDDIDPITQLDVPPYPPLNREISYADALSRVSSHRPVSHHERTVIVFHTTDPDNPDNWPKLKKLLVVAGGLVTVMNSTLGSSLSSNATKFIAAEFNVTSELQLVLPISMYLMGYVLGPFLWSPLSEQYGRKPIMLPTFIGYTLFTMACALAPNWPSLLVFRLLCGCNASAPIAVVGGLYADVYHNPGPRGYAMAVFMAATCFGPCLGPVVSGYLSTTLSWRWSFWFGLIFAGVSLPAIVFMPESYAPVLLHKRAVKLRKDTGDPNIVSKSELSPTTWEYLITKVLARPIMMLFHESIVMFTCMYMSLAYGIFYLFFQAYPLIFEGEDSIYHFSPGASGLTFLPIGVGAALSLIVFFAYDSYLNRSRKLNKPWTQIEEYRRLPLACIGGPFLVISLFWLGFSSRPDINFIVPCLSGGSFGMGFLLIMMALMNYLTDAYETYAASAQGIGSTCRSLFGALLPLAANKMYTNLGIKWASALLGFCGLGMAIIPFAFIKYGERIREGSRFCRELKEMERREREEEVRQEDMRRRIAGVEGQGSGSGRGEDGRVGDDEVGSSEDDTVAGDEFVPVEDRIEDALEIDVEKGIAGR